MKRAIFILVVLCIAIFAFACGKGNKNTSETKEKENNQEEIGKKVAEADSLWKEFRYKDAMAIYSELIAQKTPFSSTVWGIYSGKDTEANKIYVNYALQCAECTLCKSAINKLKAKLLDPESLAVDGIRCRTDWKDASEVDVKRRDVDVTIYYRAKNRMGGMTDNLELCLAQFTDAELKALHTSAKRWDSSEQEFLWTNIYNRSFSNKEKLRAIVDGTANWDISFFR